jgi:hypothetical protein
MTPSALKYPRDHPPHYLASIVNKWSGTGHHPSVAPGRSRHCPSPMHASDGKRAASFSPQRHSLSTVGGRCFSYGPHRPGRSSNVRSPPITIRASPRLPLWRSRRRHRDTATALPRALPPPGPIGIGGVGAEYVALRSRKRMCGKKRSRERAVLHSLGGGGPRKLPGRPRRRSRSLPQRTFFVRNFLFTINSMLYYL